MSSVPTTVDTEAGSPLEGLELTEAQQLQLYNDVSPPCEPLRHAKPALRRPSPDPHALPHRA